MGKGRGSAEYFSPQVKEKEKKNERGKSVENGQGEKVLPSTFRLRSDFAPQAKTKTKKKEKDSSV